MKLTFDPAEESQEVEDFLRGPRALSCLWDIQQEVFRPARKHGYPDPVVQVLLRKIDELHDDCLGTELVGELERLFGEILNKHDVKL